MCVCVLWCVAEAAAPATPAPPSMKYGSFMTAPPTPQLYLSSSSIVVVKERRGIARGETKRLAVIYWDRDRKEGEIKNGNDTLWAPKVPPHSLCFEALEKSH